MPSRYKLEPGRLCHAARRSRELMQRQRNEFTEMCREIAGAHYSDKGTEHEVYVNLMAMFLSIMSRSMISQSPRFLYTPADLRLGPAVAAMQSYVNGEVERMRLGDTLQMGVQAGLCSIHAALVHLATPLDAARFGWGVKAGEPIVSGINLDDLVVDMQATDWDDLGYAGWRCRYPMEAVKQYKFFDKIRKRLPETTHREFDEFGGERAGSISRGTLGGVAYDAEEMVDLWHIYSYRHRCIYTYSDDQFLGIGADEKPLAEMDFIGPDRGPIEFLIYGRVPGNLWPKAPMMDLVGLHRAANICVGKLAEVADRLKEIVLVADASADTGETIVRANDGEVHRVKNVDQFVQVVFSGKHAQVLDAMARTFKELFSFVGGNLELIGGRSQQAGTAKQEELLQANSTASIADLQERTQSWVQRIGESLSWYWWRHPKLVMDAQYAPNGMQEFAQPTPVYPGSQWQPGRLARVGPMPAVRCDPYTLRRQTPESRARILREFVQGLYQPMAQLFMQQGLMLDMKYVALKLGEYLDSPELVQALNLQPPMQDTGMSHETGTRMPMNTERRYVRESESQAGPQQDHNMIANAYGTDLGGSPSKNGQLQGAY